MSGPMMEQYRTKKALTAAIRAIATGMPLRTPLFGFDLALMLEVFAQHPRAAEKLRGGVQRVEVRRAARNPKNREFWIQRTDGSWTDISWVHCLKQPTALADFIATARLEIEGQVQAYLDRHFEGRVLAPCEWSGALLGRAQGDVHHDGAWPFRATVTAFIEADGVDVTAVEYDGRHDGSTVEPFRDRELAARWRAFHRERAELRFIAKSLHRELPRSGAAPAQEDDA